MRHFSTQFFRYESAQIAALREDALIRNVPGLNEVAHKFDFELGEHLLDLTGRLAAPAIGTESRSH